MEPPVAERPLAERPRNTRIARRGTATASPCRARPRNAVSYRWTAPLGKTGPSSSSAPPPVSPGAFRAKTAPTRRSSAVGANGTRQLPAETTAGCTKAKAAIRRARALRRFPRKERVSGRCQLRGDRTACGYPCGDGDWTVTGCFATATDPEYPYGEGTWQSDGVCEAGGAGGAELLTPRIPSVASGRAASKPSIARARTRRT